MMMHENTSARKVSQPSVRHPGRLPSAAYFGLQNARRWRAPEDGVLTLAGGASAWITRDNDLDDHVLAVGERLSVRRGDELIAEPLHAGEQAWLDWQADAEPVQLPVVRRAAGFFADGLLALARSAEAIARRPQASMADGASMASSGALK